MSLVIFTCAVGLLTAPGEISFFKSITNIFFVTLGAGAAGALNMWYEADLDKLMSRNEQNMFKATSNRKTKKETCAYFWNGPISSFSFRTLLFFKPVICFSFAFYNQFLFICLYNLA